MAISYTIEVKAIGGYTAHSEHDSYAAAVDQCDMVHGRIIITQTGATDVAAHKYAVDHQGFVGDYADWQRLEDLERDTYEYAAAGLPT